MSEAEATKTAAAEKKPKQKVELTEEEKQARKEQQEKAREAKKQRKAQNKAAQGQGQKGKKQGKGKSDQLGLTVTKEGDFADWYRQVITKAELIDYYDVSGCFILRPWSYAVWEHVHTFFDAEIKKLGVRNAYFPLLVSERALTAEKDHIEGFSPEVAWVTRSGQSDMAQPVAIRPTSETIMYPAYAKWIRSHRDLPLKLNQWSNVVRWEFKDAVPFLRTREFLWQEGHSAFATLPEADEEVLAILQLYRRVFEDLMAVPVRLGRKSEKEKFAGGLYTTTCEAFIPTNGRAIQGATSHCLGQNFAKMFNIEFEDTEGKKAMVWQNSWGITTRTIGVMVMVHGDDKGLVMPPRVAPVQVIVIPLYFKGSDDDVTDTKADAVCASLNAAGIRAEVDKSKLHGPGFKYAHWEVRGVPLRVEIGPKDIEKNQVKTVRRDTRESAFLPVDDTLPTQINTLLDTVQNDLLTKARAKFDERTVTITSWDDFVPTLNKQCICLCPWCDNTDCEEAIKDKSGKESVAAAEENGFGLTGSAKSLCTPFDQPDLPEGSVCFHCGQPAKQWTLFGRSY